MNIITTIAVAVVRRVRLRALLASLLTGAALFVLTGVSPSQTASVPVPFSEPVSFSVLGAPQEAAAVATNFRSGPTSQRQMRVHHGYHGLGDADYLEPGEFSELAFVGSVKYHKGWKLQVWQPLMERYKTVKNCKEKGGYHNFIINYLWRVTMREVRA